jgi:hypothetical protein
MDLVVLILLVIGITSLVVSWIRADLSCPPPKVIYRYIPKHPLDIQFGEENKASDIFFDMYTEGIPWAGGYQIDYGKTYSKVTTSQ